MFTDTRAKKTNEYAKVAMTAVITIIVILLGVLIHTIWVQQSMVDAQTTWIISEPSAIPVPESDIEEHSELETYWEFADFYDDLSAAEQHQFCADAYEQGYGAFSVQLWVDAYRFQGINHDLQAITEMLFSRCG